MSEEQEIRASHQEVEQFVSKLKEFHSSLEEGEQAMLVTILEEVQIGDTGAYGIRRGRYGGPDEGSSGSETSSGWNDLVGWIEEQGEEDTQGFAVRCRYGEQDAGLDGVGSSGLVPCTYRRAVLEGGMGVNVNWA
jgi:hypothetical protein